VAVASTGLLLTPVILYRTVFRRHRKELLIRVANALDQAGLVLLGPAGAGAIVLIFDMVAARRPGWSRAG
jgi:hypothetical protein